jgi:hypothetical protein
MASDMPLATKASMMPDRTDSHPDTNILVGLVDADAVYRNIGYARVKCG